MTRAPVDRFAIHFEIASEMNAPPIPITAEMTSSAVMLMPPPSVSSIRSTPRMRSEMFRMNRMAKFVATNRSIRVMTFEHSVKRGPRPAVLSEQCGGASGEIPEPAPREFDSQPQFRTDERRRESSAIGAPAPAAAGPRKAACIDCSLSVS